MSEEEAALSRKERKALRDAGHKKQGKKRKHDDTDEVEGLLAPDGETHTTAKPPTKRQAPADGDGEHDVAVTAATTAPDDEDTSAAQPKRKRRRKTKSEDSKPARNRFIVFVGNLPFKTTDSSLDKHFAKLKPYVLRHRTDPKTKKSKGFAFLEFENYDRMKTCLKLYHHSLFDPEAIERGEAVIEPGTEEEQQLSTGRAAGRKKESARRINVELTAGGGGKTEGRKEKIKEKNVRLNEQRQRRADLEKVEKAKAERESRGAGEKKGKKSGKDEVEVKGGKRTIVQELQEKAVATDASAGAEESYSIHPSRLAMMQ